MTTQVSEEFISNVEKLLQNEELDFYKSGLNSCFERACDSLFYSIRDKEIWHDGIINTEVRKRKSQQIEIKGAMWVARGSNKQWLEPFSALVTDRRITKQGIRLSVNIGEYYAEGEICDLI